MTLLLVKKYYKLSQTDFLRLVIEIRLSQIITLTAFCFDFIKIRYISDKL